MCSSELRRLALQVRHDASRRDIRHEGLPAWCVDLYSFDRTRTICTQARETVDAITRCSLHGEAKWKALHDHACNAVDRSSFSGIDDDSWIFTTACYAVAVASFGPFSTQSIVALSDAIVCALLLARYELTYSYATLLRERVCSVRRSLTLSRQTHEYMTWVLHVCSIFLEADVFSNNKGALFTTMNVDLPCLRVLDVVQASRHVVKQAAKDDNVQLCVEHLAEYANFHTNSGVAGRDVSATSVSPFFEPFHFESLFPIVVGTMLRTAYKASCKDNLRIEELHAKMSRLRQRVRDASSLLTLAGIKRQAERLQGLHKQRTRRRNGMNDIICTLLQLLLFSNESSELSRNWKRSSETSFVWSLWWFGISWSVTHKLDYILYKRVQQSCASFVRFTLSSVNSCTLKAASLLCCRDSLRRIRSCVPTPCSSSIHIPVSRVRVDSCEHEVHLDSEGELSPVSRSKLIMEIELHVLHHER